MTISVIGAGAFGTALAVTWAGAGHAVTLWGRDVTRMDNARTTRAPACQLDLTLPDNIHPTSDIDLALANDTVILAIPAQTLGAFLTQHAVRLAGKTLIAACKGIDLETMTGPVARIEAIVPDAKAGILTGPSFAVDIAIGLPTALTLATRDADAGEALQQQLSTKTLRLYRTTDTVGAELGGALKNVMAIACGVTMGARLGESARAAVITRGFAEMQRLAATLGADPETLTGLSGFGDLVLTCTSDKSRNYRYGLALGAREPFDKSVTVEGAATAKSVSKLAKSLKIDLPICTVVADLIDARQDVTSALRALLSRPLKEE